MKKRLISFLLAALLLVSAVVVGAPTVSAAAERKASDKLINLIKEFEGFLQYAKEDYGQYTIGYGTSCGKNEYPNGITKEKAETLLRDAVSKFEKNVNDFAAKQKLTLSQQQFDALVSFTYNLGPSWLNNASTLRTAVIKGEKGNDFIYGITMWCMAGSDGEKKILPNLVERRLCEANVYLNGVYSSDAPSNYTYVAFDHNIDSPSNVLRIQGYDANLTDTVRANPTKSGYRFLGWYTTATGGEWITKLDATTAGKTLYGHWQKGDGTAAGVSANYKRITAAEVVVRDKANGKEINRIPMGTTVTVVADYMDANGVKWGKTNGGWIDLSKTTTEKGGYGDQNLTKPVVVVVNTDGVNIRKGPGTNYAKVGKANKGQVLTLTAVHRGTNYLWGEFSGGWICLDYTNYDDAISGATSGESDVTATGVIVKTDKLNVRNRPGTSGTTVIGSYSRGDVVTITNQQKVGSTTWGKTPKGWISLYYVDVTPTGSGTTEKPGDTGSGSTTSEKVIATGVIVDCTSLRIRKGPGTNYAQVGSLAAGTEVKIYEQILGGQGWARIDRGWISLTYVELDVPVTDSKDAQNGTVVLCDRLNVRKGPGTSYERVAKLNVGTKVQILETTMVKNVKWGRTSLGWVSMEYIKLDNAAAPETEKPDTNKPEAEKPETEKPETQKPVDGNTGTATAKTGSIVKTTELRVRAGAGTNYEKVGTLKKGDRVVILETAKVGNATWGRIEKGWIHMYYVQLDGAEVPSGTISRTVTTELRIRAGAGTKYDKVGTYQKGEVVLIYETTIVNGFLWGRTDKGWISMEYVK